MLPKHSSSSSSQNCCRAWQLCFAQKPLSLLFSILNSNCTYFSISLSGFSGIVSGGFPIMVSSSSPTFPPSLPLPSPRTPPKFPDLYGRHRTQAEIQRLNREIGFLEEELQSIDGLQPASRCCKEVDEFVGTNPDPLIPSNRKIRRSFCLWKIPCLKSCFNFSWICCSSGCSLHLEIPHCVSDALKSCCSSCCCCCSCSCHCRCPCHCDFRCPSSSCCHPSCEKSDCKPKCCQLPSSCYCCSCCDKSDCKPTCCKLPTLPCPDCSWGCLWSCFSCINKCLCPKCTKNCCLYPCPSCC